MTTRTASPQTVPARTGDDRRPPRWARPEPGETPATCLLCDSPRLTRSFERTDKQYWSCESCRLVFVHDIYPEYEAFDNGAYLELASHRTRQKPKDVRTNDRILQSFEPLRRTNRLLEVGCGHGFFLEQARAAGWETHGVEIVPEMVELARNDRDLDVFEGELADAGHPPESFDAVYMNEVIEHVPDPIGLMIDVHRVLGSGGQALLRTGNACSWSARCRGGSWPYYRFGPHGHIRFYGPRSAAVLAQAAGFAGVDVTTSGFAFREGAELREHWAKPLIKLAQAPLSRLAGIASAGHRLSMRFRR